jgi:hypothetical protein
MSAGKALKERLRRVRTGQDLTSGTLPLIAFYGREPAHEEMRRRFYDRCERVFNSTEIDDMEVAGNRRLVVVGGKMAIINPDAGLVEKLVAARELATERDSKGMLGIRYHTALKLRELIDGAQVKTMRSPALDREGGGGGFGPGEIRGYQLDCMRKLRRMREQLGAWGETNLADLLEDVVCHDAFRDPRPREIAQADPMPHERMLTLLHLSLDIAASSLGYLDDNSVQQRWNHEEWKNRRAGGGPVRSYRDEKWRPQLDQADLRRGQSSSQD